MSTEMLQRRLAERETRPLQRRETEVLIGNVVYRAAVALEALEHAKLLRGNGHHMAQHVAQVASQIVRDRWSGAPPDEEPQFRQDIAVPECADCGGHWLTREGATVRIRDLDNGHLLNIERVLRSRGQDDANITAEIERRGLADQRLGLKPKDQQQVCDAVTTLRALFKHLSPGEQKHIVQGTLAAFFREQGMDVVADECATWRP